MQHPQQVPVNGIQISYYDSGTGSKTIIFLHGFPFDKSTWLPQLEALGDDYRVIAYDARCFGESGCNREKPGMSLFADDLVGFIDALNIVKPVVCGLSMGGYVLLNAVNRYPDKFGAIVLCDTQCLPDSKEGIQNRFETIRDIEENGLDEFAAGLVQKVFCKNTLESNKELVEKIRQLILATPSDAIALALEALAKRRETCSILKNIKVPALVLCGEEDSITPVPRSEFIFNTIAGAQMHIIKNAGHLSNLEQPEVFNQHLRRFVEELSLQPH